MEKKNIVSAIMKGDNWLWGIYVFLLCFSLVEMFSASSRLAYLPSATTNDSPVFSHAKNLLFGLALALLFQSATKMLIKWMEHLTFWGGLSLLIAMFFVGTTVKGGSVRSVFGVQPVEICKVGLMMLLCDLVTAKDAFYHRFSFFREHTQGRRVIAMCVVIGIIGLLIASQNLSSALIIGIAAVFVMLLGGVRIRYMLMILALGVSMLILGLAALRGLYASDEYRRGVSQELVDLGPANRAHTWASRIFSEDDEAVPYWKQSLHGDNSQVIHAHLALANSFPIPQGPGNSRLRDYLPEAYSDYIFAIIFEEWGFFGALFIIALYVTLLMRCFVLSRRTEDPYIRLMIVALPLVMVVQALVHIGVCTDAMFVTGQPLPLISRGGSGIYMTSVSFGFMLALSRLIDAEVQQRNKVAEPEPVSTPETISESVDQTS